jgi:hypothetical protein
MGGFFFGRGWILAWQIVLYLLMLLFVFAPSLGALPLKTRGMKPDPASLGSFGFVMIQAVGVFVATLGTAWIAARGLDASGWVKFLLVCAATTVLTGVTLYLSSALFTTQGPPAMAAFITWALAITTGYLWALAWSGARVATQLSMRPGTLGVVALGLLSLPVAAVIVLRVLGVILNR